MTGGSLNTLTTIIARPAGTPWAAGLTHRRPSFFDTYNSRVILSAAKDLHMAT
jgi:hypothetical protein